MPVANLPATRAATPCNSMRRASPAALLHLLRASPEQTDWCQRTRHPCPAPIARSAFAGFCFPSDVIVLAVRWYLRFGLSYRDVEELLAE